MKISLHTLSLKEPRPRGSETNTSFSPIDMEHMFIIVICAVKIASSHCYPPIGCEYVCVLPRMVPFFLPKQFIPKFSIFWPTKTQQLTVVTHLFLQDIIKMT
ncbi:hypothetical protein CHARACLAT_032064 [Characodon lateralis]|uniref:Uncharacterized protein n=1 Tax=Characodon lateralis TaxID=208331 RepID=A0ABU7EEM2_9TELE|nr:hypothetical protein [Characodon lateralis]